MTNTPSYENLRHDIAGFVSERDWQQFHSPKNLAMALSVEVSELVEIFQWLTEEQSGDETSLDLAHLEDEIGDVMIYLTMLAEKFGLNPIAAAEKKMKSNINRYPAEKHRGRAQKSEAR